MNIRTNQDAEPGRDNPCPAEKVSFPVSKKRMLLSLPALPVWKGIPRISAPRIIPSCPLPENAWKNVNTMPPEKQNSHIKQMKA
jgi:hypothetical protein